MNKELGNCPMCDQNAWKIEYAQHDMILHCGACDFEMILKGMDGIIEED